MVWGENCKRYIANLVKLLLGQLSAYQCLIHLYKTEVMDTSHEYLTYSSFPCQTAPFTSNFVKF